MVNILSVEWFYVNCFLAKIYLDQFSLLVMKCTFFTVMHSVEKVVHRETGANFPFVKTLCKNI